MEEAIRSKNRQNKHIRTKQAEEETINISNKAIFTPAKAILSSVAHSGE
jgi:hypothetical protein